MSRLVAAPPPNRVRSPTDRQFASGCSPRRFEPTQLPLASELWHTPARTFTVLMWRPHRRTHSRMFLAGIQAKLRLDPRLLHSGVTTFEKILINVFCVPQLAAWSFVKQFIFDRAAKQTRSSRFRARSSRR